MKLKRFILVVILMLAGAHAVAEAEFRAVWVHNWRPGLLCPAEVEGTVRWAKESNMNALIVQVRRVGDAYYNSAYEPRASNIQGGPDFDPLDCVVKQARANGMEVHAWLNLYRISPKNTPPSEPGHVANLHPEWLSKDVNGAKSAEEGMFLDPGVPEARDFLVEIAADLMGKYDLDGLMLDYVRYPGKTWGYNDISIARFNERYGRTGKPSPDDPQWCDWRREQVTETVRAIYKRIHALKPQVKISAATIAWGECPPDFTRTSAYGHVFQDWRLWMQEGIIDANMPMNYKDPSNPKQSKAFASWVRGAKKWSYGRHVYCGIMLYKQTAGVAAQVKLTRTCGADGVVGLAFSQADSPQREALARQLRSNVFAKPVSVPSMPWKSVSAQLPDPSSLPPSPLTHTLTHTLTLTPLLARQGWALGEYE